MSQSLREQLQGLNSLPKKSKAKTGPKHFLLKQKEAKLLEMDAAQLSEDDKNFLQERKRARNLAEQKKCQNEARINRQKLITKGLNTLKEKFPEVCGNTIKPLALGVFKEIASVLQNEGISITQSRLIMRVYSKSTSYLQAVISGEHRYGLDGQIKGNITDDEKLYATKILNERIAKKSKT